VKHSIFSHRSLPRIIDDETFEFDTSFSQAIDLSSFNILNFDVLDPNGKAMIPLTVKPQTVGGRTSATYRFASDAPLANGTYQVNARANQLLSFQHSTPPQFWEYVQDRNVGPLNIKFTCPPITTVPELKQGGSAIWAMDVYDKKEPPNNYIKNYGCTITCAAMVLDYFCPN
jgi:hypothetical protein